MLHHFHKGNSYSGPFPLQQWGMGSEVGMVPELDMFDMVPELDMTHGSGMLDMLPGLYMLGMVPWFGMMGMNPQLNTLYMFHGWTFRALLLSWILPSGWAWFWLWTLFLFSSGFLWRAWCLCRTCFRFLGHNQLTVLTMEPICACADVTSFLIKACSTVLADGWPTVVFT